MKMLMYVVCCFMFLAVFSGMTGLSFADDAAVLPKGVSTISIESYFYQTFDEKYDPDGNEESAAEEFNAVLDDKVFRDIPPGFSFGETIVDFEYEAKLLDILLAYGVTDKLTIGMQIYYIWWDNNVKSRVDTKNANMGKNPFYDPEKLDPQNPLTFPFIPTAFGGIPINEDDMQGLLGGGLDVNGDGSIDVPGLGFEKFGSWSYTGLEDIEIGAKYQYFRNDDWQLAFRAGLILPTGQDEDPNVLTDRSTTANNFATLLRFSNDYTGIENLLLSTTFKWGHVFPYQKKMRVPADVDQPITEDLEKLKVRPGDSFTLEANVGYKLPKGFSVGLKYSYLFSTKSNFSGTKGLDYDVLEEETDATAHIYKVSLGYNTFDLFKKKKFPLPLKAFVAYRDRFAGTNNVLNSQYISTGLQFYF